ncbi:MAG: hypothetical protein ABL888_13270 [Pirellulaceae bacterium]
MTNQDRFKILRAMRDPDHWVIRMEYQDEKNVRTRRIVSPIRFTNAARTHLLALCCAREEPRMFFVNNIGPLTLEPAADFVMPHPVEEING